MQLGKKPRYLDKRKQASWNALKTENSVVNIYKKCRQEENTITMPRKFHIKIAREDETEKTIIENLALQKIDAEIALLATDQLGILNDLKILIP